MDEKIFYNASRLVYTLGFDTVKRDKSLLRICCDSAEKEFLARCGLRKLPDEAVKNVAMAAVGEFFVIKRSLCQLGEFVPDYEGIKSVTEGDSSVTYRDGGYLPFDEVIEFLRRAGKCDVYRRLSW